MIDPVTEKIQNLDGRFFWEKKHNDLNFEDDNLGYPFGLTILPISGDSDKPGSSRRMKMLTSLLSTS